MQPPPPHRARQMTAGNARASVSMAVVSARVGGYVPGRPVPSKGRWAGFGGSDGHTRNQERANSRFRRAGTCSGR
eukprot:2275223-Pleurochrysis_carterae.AAC.2